MRVNHRSFADLAPETTTTAEPRAPKRRLKDARRVRREARNRADARRGGRRLSKRKALHVVAEEFRALIPVERPLLPEPTLRVTIADLLKGKS